MNFTIDQIIEHQERLEREIAERESLLAVFKVFYTYMKGTEGPKFIDLGLLVSTLTPTASRAALQDAPASLPPPVAQTLPIPAPAPHYVHPDLREWQRQSGGLSAAVRWAIERMTADYSLRDLHAMLKREGFFIRPGQVSVILTRMRLRGEIERIQHGFGPEPDIYRGPEPELLSETPSAGELNEPETTAAAAIAV